jgi:hypothetical protein
MKSLRLTVIFLVALGFGACGGSGGGSDAASGGGGAGGSGGGGSSAITATNAKGVATEGFTGMDAVGLGTGTGNALYNVDSLSHGVLRFSNSGSSLADLFQKRLTRLAARPTVRSAGFVATVVEAVNEPCDVSGTITGTWNDADSNGEDSTGDTYNLTFNNCRDIADETVTGNTAITGFVLAGDLNADYSMTATFTLSNLRIVGSDFDYTYNGAANYAGSRSGNQLTETVTISSLTLAMGAVTQTLSGATVNITDNEVTQSYTIAFDGTINSNALGFSITVDTTTPFAGVDDDNVNNGMPTSGSMTITASDSALIMTATGGNNVRLDVDTNKDGGIDAVVNTTWSEIF